MCLAALRNSEEAGVEWRAVGEWWGEIRGVTGPDWARPCGPGRMLAFTQWKAADLTLGFTGSLGLLDRRPGQRQDGHWEALAMIQARNSGQGKGVLPRS